MNQSDTSIVSDIVELNHHAGLDEWILNNADNPQIIKEWIAFRLNLLSEELHEGVKAHALQDGAEFVDAMIDSMVIAAGTLQALGVDINHAWFRVHNANMDKNQGIKPGRPNPLGLPDLVKPAGWTAPDHSNNQGLLKNTYKKDNINDNSN